MSDQLIDKARSLLEKFEREMGHPRSVIQLSDALGLLGDVAIDVTSSSELQQRCKSIAFTYAKKVQDKVQSLLNQEDTIDWETIDHWRRILSEFETSDFEFPGVAKCQSALWMRMVENLSLSDQKRLLQLLQDRVDKKKGH